MATAQSIGIVSAVVLGGLGYWYMSKDEEEETTTTVTGGGVQTPPGQATPECSDDLGCPADEPYCIDGKCTDKFNVSEYFTEHSGSPYPKFGMSNMWRNLADKTNEPRAQYEGLDAAAAACEADPTCIGFSWWPERYDNYNPKTDSQECSADSECLGLDRDGTMKTKGKCYEDDDGKSYCRHPAWNLSYFYTDAEAPGDTPSDWEGNSWKSTNGALTFGQSVGPSDEYLDTRRPRADHVFDYAGDGTDERYVYEEHLKQKGITYIKKGYKDYKPSDKWNDDRTPKTPATSAAENVENPFYKPTSSPTGSGYQISDKQSCVDWRQW
tara:strand:+ start:383 stop:1357 length:975 start_codon:yes stop_codon:yes gene_type:complete